MEQHQIMAFVMVGVAIMDMLVAFLIVLPKSPPEKRGLLQVVFTMTSLGLFGLAAAFWFKVIEA